MPAPVCDDGYCSYATVFATFSANRNSVNPEGTAEFIRFMCTSDELNTLAAQKRISSVSAAPDDVLFKLFNSVPAERIVLIGANLLVVAAILLGIITYNRSVREETVQIGQDSFIASTDIVSQMADSYLVADRQVCDNWATYINSRQMTMEEAVAYLSDAGDSGNTFGHVIWADTLWM